jgi:hypothetical protein
MSYRATSALIQELHTLALQVRAVHDDAGHARLEQLADELGSRFGVNPDTAPDSDSADEQP